MIVRRVARPAARRHDDFTVDHVGVRRIVVVEDRADRTLCRALPDTATEDIRLDILRAVEDRCEVAVVDGLLDQELRFLQSLDDDLDAVRHVQAVRVLIEQRLAVHDLFLTIPRNLYIARRDDECRLLERIFELDDLVLVHLLIADIHEHIALARRHCIVAVLELT